METFILKLALVVVLLAVPVASTTIISHLSSCYSRHPLSWQRKRRNMLRSLAAGVMLR
jgi:hypothetical protein